MRVEDPKPGKVPVIVKKSKLLNPLKVKTMSKLQILILQAAIRDIIRNEENKFLKSYIDLKTGQVMALFLN
jgi:hypothetical protein